MHIFFLRFQVNTITILFKGLKTCYLKKKYSATVQYKLSAANQEAYIEQLAERYEINMVPYGDSPAENNLPILRVTKKQLLLEHNNSTLFFHPGMSLLRMINIKRGEGDRFLDALSLAEGDILLDATMGLGSDALIASWALGERGKVFAVEHSPLIFMLVKEGLERLGRLTSPQVKSIEKKKAWLELAQASSRIEAICSDHLEVLKKLPDNSVDVIYFDPMFRTTVKSSASIKPLKEWSNPAPVTQETINQACRVAKKRIVLKERRYSGEFVRLGFKTSAGSEYSSIGFGIIDLN